MLTVPLPNSVNFLSLRTITTFWQRTGITNFKMGNVSVTPRNEVLST